MCLCIHLASQARHETRTVSRKTKEADTLGLNKALPLGITQPGFRWERKTGLFQWGAAIWILTNQVCTWFNKLCNTRLWSVRKSCKIKATKLKVRTVYSQKVWVIVLKCRYFFKYWNVLLNNPVLKHYWHMYTEKSFCATNTLCSNSADANMRLQQLVKLDSIWLLSFGGGIVT